MIKKTILKHAVYVSTYIKYHASRKQPSKYYEEELEFIDQIDEIENFIKSKDIGVYKKESKFL